MLEDLLSSELSYLKKYHPSGNKQFINLGTFQRLKLRNLLGQIFRIYLELNFTLNTLGYYGLIENLSHVIRNQ